MMLTAPASERMPALNCPASTGFVSTPELFSFSCDHSKHGTSRLFAAGPRLPRRGRDRGPALPAPGTGLGARLSHRRRHHRPLGPAPDFRSANGAGLLRVRRGAAALSHRPGAESLARVVAA